MARFSEYIAQYSTESMLMIGTDYGHVDMSVEIDALRTLEKNGKVRPELAKKILQDNPARFYGIQLTVSDEGNSR